MLTASVHAGRTPPALLNDAAATENRNTPASAHARGQRTGYGHLLSTGQANFKINQ